MPFSQRKLNSLNSSQYSPSFPSQQGSLNKREAKNSSEQGSFLSHIFSHQDSRWLKEAGYPHARGSAQKHLFAGPRCSTEQSASRKHPRVAPSSLDYCSSSTWRGPANPRDCRRHQMVTLCSSAALCRAIRSAGFDLYSTLWFPLEAVFLPVSYPCSRDQWGFLQQDVFYSSKQVTPQTVPAHQTHQEQVAFL